MSSPDPLADILANCHVARRAIADAQSIVEACIVEIEKTCVSDRENAVDTKDSDIQDELPAHANAS